ncbi:MAG TPA: PIN domain-containing protein [Bryobacteraceae bacterium]|nr:PIN domain-containing protein [Bryobacteraceae bacterium]
MTGKTFVDSNILIYAHDSGAGQRQQQATESLSELWATRTGRLSTQVLQEFYVNVTQKIKAPLSRSAAREVIRAYVPWVESLITPATVARASEIGEVWQVSFWDGMILAAAEQIQATELLTEDLTHGQVIAGVRIVNPFLQRLNF